MKAKILKDGEGYLVEIWGIFDKMDSYFVERVEAEKGVKFSHIENKPREGKRRP